MGAAIVALALLPLVAMVTIWQFGSDDPLIAFGAEAPATNDAASVGGSRDTQLRLLTERYMSQNEGISAGMKAGTELAPIEFLNGELEREGRKWRVRTVDGLVVDIYDIS
jgi:hypothetical protein